MAPPNAPIDHELINVLSKILEKHRDSLIKIIAIKENLDPVVLRSLLTERIDVSYRPASGTIHERKIPTQTFVTGPFDTRRL